MNLRVLFPKICNLTPPPPKITHKRVVSMIEKWKESVDNGGAFVALMTDLSKAFDCLHHARLWF